MRRTPATAIMMVLLLGSLAALGAPPTSQDDLEPAVDTSRLPPQATSSAPAPAPMKSAAGSAPKAAGSRAAPKAQAAGKTMDRVDLDPTRITGNSELPKVMYVVPWKRSDLGDAVGKPANSLIDEVLEPVDRDVFNRENRYYHALPQQAAAARDAKDDGKDRKD